MTPLLTAAMRGRKDAFLPLLRHDAKTDATGTEKYNKGKTAFELAREYAGEESVKALEAAIDEKVKPPRLSSP